MFFEANTMKYIKIFLVFAIFSVASAILFVSFYEKKYERYLMLFKNKVTGDIEIENRYISLDTDKENLNVFVEEFLLGPASNNLISFFPPSISYRSMFLRDNVLYLDLSKDAVSHMPSGIEFEDFYTLFNKSLKLNFPELKGVHIFIEGVKAYEKA